MRARYLTFLTTQPVAPGASPWTPASISGLKLWIDFSDADTLFTDDGSTKVTADADKIYRSNDKSGNNYYASNWYEASRPLYKTSIINGLSVASFVDSNDALRMPSDLTLDAFSVVFVIRPVTLQWNGLFFSSMSQAHYIGSQGGNIRMRTTGTSNTELTARSQIADNNNYILSITYDGSTAKAYKNGSDISAGGKSMTGTYVFEFLSSANIFQLGEVAVYNTALSDANRQAVEVYLNAKWNIYH